MSDSTNVHFPDALVDVVLADPSGYPNDLAAGDTAENLALMGAKDFPQALYIDPKDWQDKARENDKLGTWAENRRNRFTNQNPTHECTCHALIQVCETAWNASRGSKDAAVLFSPLSVYAEANPGQWGGASCQQVLGIAMRRGVLPEPVDGQKERFKHTLHGTTGKGNAHNASGPWVPLSKFPEGWEETAKFFKPTEVINPRTYEELICCLLHGRAVGVGRSGHSVPYQKVVWRDGDLYVQYSDSYDVNRFDSVGMIRSAVGGSYCIWSMTVPDDWDKPAG